MEDLEGRLYDPEIVNAKFGR